MRHGTLSDLVERVVVVGIELGHPFLETYVVLVPSARWKRFQKFGDELRKIPVAHCLQQIECILNRQFGRTIGDRRKALPSFGNHLTVILRLYHEVSI